MRAVDSNVLIYAYFSDSEFHERAASTVKELAEGTAPWAIPWACIHEFFGVVTRRVLFPDGAGPAAALAQIDEWLRSPSLQMLSESRVHWRTLRRLVADADVTGPVIHDAKIAAICLDHGVTEFITVDREFRRFPELRVSSIISSRG